ncbi:YraN family protein [Paraburkholderia megapolitana]|uniref:YraN family protein n=1 Tax=Paraburkholderia megapolitana TaxID=420953 RepID=UPI0038B9A1C2
MRRNPQTDEARPPLCHAPTRALDRVASAPTPARVQSTGDNFPRQRGSKLVGAAFEAHALVFLQHQRLRFVARNVVCRGGEIDLVMRDRDDTLVFVEVRARAQRRYGGAAASVGWHKRQRLLRAAQFFLATRLVHQNGEMPACRFDVVAFEAGRLIWLRDAFRADDR